MPRRQKASTIFSFRRNGRHSTVENGWTQKGTDFIGPLKILSYAKPVIPRPVRRLVVGIRSLLAGFLFRSDGCFSFVGTVPPAAHFSHQLEKWTKAHTVVSAGFQPRCGVKIGTLPRNHLASSATGGASAVSAKNQWFLDFLSFQEFRSVWAKGIDSATVPLPLRRRGVWVYGWE